MTSPVLEVSQLGRAFSLANGSTLVAVEDISFAVSRGETLGIVGESGCGKSTLARMILKLLPVTSGTIELEGCNVTHLSEQAMRPLRHVMQAVFQDPMSSLNPRMRVGEIVAEPLRAMGVSRSERDRRVDEALSTVGLSQDARDRFPHAFSGGQRQRIAIARALVAEARIIICDEATSALDVSVQAQVLNLLAELRKTLDLSLIFISHNLGAVRHISDRVAVMYLGRIVEFGTEIDVFDRPSHPYTQALLAAVPEPTPGLAAPVPLSGEVPSPLARPTGCHFHTRCPKMQGICREISPPLASRREGHEVRCHFPD